MRKQLSRIHAKGPQSISGPIGEMSMRNCNPRLGGWGVIYRSGQTWQPKWRCYNGRAPHAALHSPTENPVAGKTGRAIVGDESGSYGRTRGVLQRLNLSSSALQQLDSDGQPTHSHNLYFKWRRLVAVLIIVLSPQVRKNEGVSMHGYSANEPT